MILGTQCSLQSDVKRQFVAAGSIPICSFSSFFLSKIREVNFTFCDKLITILPHEN